MVHRIDLMNENLILDLTFPHWKRNVHAFDFFAQLFHAFDRKGEPFRSWLFVFWAFVAGLGYITKKDLIDLLSEVMTVDVHTRKCVPNEMFRVVLLCCQVAPHISQSTVDLLFAQVSPQHLDKRTKVLSNRLYCLTVCGCVCVMVVGRHWHQRIDRLPRVWANDATYWIPFEIRVCGRTRFALKCAAVCVFCLVDVESAQRFWNWRRRIWGKGF